MNKTSVFRLLATFESRLEVLGCFLVECVHFGQQIDPLDRGWCVDLLFEHEHPDAVDNENAAGLLEREGSLVVFVPLQAEAPQKVQGRITSYNVCYTK